MGRASFATQLAAQTGVSRTARASIKGRGRGGRGSYSSRTETGRHFGLGLGLCECHMLDCVWDIWHHRPRAAAMRGRPAPMVNRAGAVAWCTEKRGMPSMPCAESGVCWWSRPSAVLVVGCGQEPEELASGSLTERLEARQRIGATRIYIGIGGSRLQWLWGTAMDRVTATLGVRQVMVRASRVARGRSLGWPGWRVDGPAISHPIRERRAWDD